MTAEEWRPIPGYEGIYEVSDQGRVRSLDRVRHLGGRRLRGQDIKPSSNGRGRLQVGLRRDGQSRALQVHRLVLAAFVGPCPDGMQACHWDDDPSNNTLANLRWDTPSANMLDRVRLGTHHWAVKTHCIRGHAYDESNTYIKPTNGARACRECKRAQHRRTYVPHPRQPHPVTPCPSMPGGIVSETSPRIGRR